MECIRLSLATLLKSSPQSGVNAELIPNWIQVSLPMGPIKTQFAKGRVRVKLSEIVDGLEPNFRNLLDHANRDSEVEIPPNEIFHALTAGGATSLSEEKQAAVQDAKAAAPAFVATPEPKPQTVAEVLAPSPFAPIAPTTPVIEAKSNPFSFESPTAATPSAPTAPAEPAPKPVLDTQSPFNAFAPAAPSMVPDEQAPKSAFETQSPFSSFAPAAAPIEPAEQAAKPAFETPSPFSAFAPAAPSPITPAEEAPKPAFETQSPFNAFAPAAPSPVVPAEPVKATFDVPASSSSFAPAAPLPVEESTKPAATSFWPVAAEQVPLAPTEVIPPTKVAPVISAEAVEILPIAEVFAPAAPSPWQHEAVTTETIPPTPQATANPIQETSAVSVPSVPASPPVIIPANPVTGASSFVSPSPVEPPAPVSPVISPIAPVTEFVSVPHRNGKASKQLLLRALLSSSLDLDPKAVVRQMGAQPGVSAVVCLHEGREVHSFSDATPEAEKYVRQASMLLSHLQSLIALTGIADTETFCMKSDERLMTFSFQGPTTVGVLHDPRRQEAGLPEKITLISRELADMLHDSPPFV